MQYLALIRHQLTIYVVHVVADCSLIQHANIRFLINLHNIVYNCKRFVVNVILNQHTYNILER